mgnify:CR=1 FL=1
MIGHAELPLILGQTELLFGDVTTWQSIKPGNEAETAAAPGYHINKPTQGYCVVLPRKMPKPADFEFAGTTLRSGGRAGRSERHRVHAEVLG